MISYEKRKRSLYLPDEYLSEMLHEAKRQDRSLSWIVQQAWLVARDDIKKLPSVADALNHSVKQRI
jgi:uncharacterized small protein (TIGR04563 family)